MVSQHHAGNGIGGATAVQLWGFFTNDDGNAVGVYVHRSDIGSGAAEGAAMRNAGQASISRDRQSRAEKTEPIGGLGTCASQRDPEQRVSSSLAEKRQLSNTAGAQIRLFVNKLLTTRSKCINELHSFHLMRVRPVLAHFGIAGVPGQFRFRIQPNNAFGAVVELFQYFGMRLTVVVPRVT